ncbi:MAG: adenosylmethionine decarboxylase [Desulfurococcales archaeon]|nr:adenosylmethionine decarboxylase [Desulfurococcales archaeon]
MTQAARTIGMVTPYTEYRVYGRHVYGSLYGCDPELLSSPDYLKKVIIGAAKVGRMTLLDVKYWHIYPGVSLVAIILESHITIHTWPEHEFATVDVYSCGKGTDPEVAFKYIAKALKACRYEYEISDRSLTK